MIHFRRVSASNSTSTVSHLDLFFLRFGFFIFHNPTPVGAVRDGGRPARGSRFGGSYTGAVRVDRRVDRIWRSDDIELGAQLILFRLRDRFLLGSWLQIVCVVL